METILRLRVSSGKEKFSVRWDKNKKLMLIETKKRAFEGKANNEILKELKRFFETNVEIVSGKKSREKALRIMASKKEVMEKLNAS